MTDAEVFVVKNPGHTTAGVALVSALRGGYQIAPELLLSTRRQGCAVKLQPSLLKPRILFVSQSCADAQHAFWAITDKVVANPSPAEWNLRLQYSSTDESRPDGEWKTLKVKYKRRPNQLLGVVQRSELTSDALADWKHTCTVDQLVKHLTLVDPARRCLLLDV